MLWPPVSIISRNKYMFFSINLAWWTALNPTLLPWEPGEPQKASLTSQLYSLFMLYYMSKTSKTRSQ